MVQNHQSGNIKDALLVSITGFNLAKGKTSIKIKLLKDCVENTIRNIGYVAKEGMKQTDITVL